MTALLLVLVALTLAVAGSLFFMDDPGYVLITLHPWTVEVSFTLFIIIMALAFLLIYFVVRTLVRVWTTPRDVRRWRGRQRTRHAHDMQARGMMELVEGDWSRAEKHLLSYLPYADNQVLSYIGAAHAAHGRGAIDVRDNYLNKARKKDPNQAFAVDLTQAVLQFRSGQLEQARQTLQGLLQQKPKNQKVLGLAVKTHEGLKDWNALLELLPDARKHGALPEEEIERLQTTAAANLLGDVEREELPNVWKRLPKPKRDDSGLKSAYVERLIELGEMDQAEALVRKALDRGWQPELVSLYGKIVGSNLAAQLKTAEKWAQRHPKDPELMLSLARICLNHELWGKARSYLEACIEAGGSLEAYNQLGQLLEQLDESEAALNYYRKGLMKAVPGESQEEPPVELKQLESSEKKDDA